MLIKGAGVVGGYAVQPAGNAGVYVIATTGLGTPEQARTAGTDEIREPVARNPSRRDPSVFGQLTLPCPFR